MVCGPRTDSDRDTVRITARPVSHYGAGLARCHNPAGQPGPGDREPIGEAARAGVNGRCRVADRAGPAPPAAPPPRQARGIRPDGAWARKPSPLRRQATQHRGDARANSGAAIASCTDSPASASRSAGSRQRPRRARTRFQRITRAAPKAAPTGRKHLRVRRAQQPARGDRDPAGARQQPGAPVGQRLDRTAPPRSRGRR